MGAVGNSYALTLSAAGAAASMENARNAEHSGPRTAEFGDSSMSLPAVGRSVGSAEGIGNQDTAALQSAVLEISRLLRMNEGASTSSHGDGGAWRDYPQRVSGENYGQQHFAYGSRSNGVGRAAQSSGCVGTSGHVDTGFRQMPTSASPHAVDLPLPTHGEVSTHPSTQAPGPSWLTWERDQNSGGYAVRLQPNLLAIAGPQGLSFRLAEGGAAESRVPVSREIGGEGPIAAAPTYEGGVFIGGDSNGRIVEGQAGSSRATEAVEAGPSNAPQRSSNVANGNGNALDVLGELGGNLVMGGGETDLRAVARWGEQVVPFVLLLLLLFIHEHFAGLVTFTWLMAVLIRANDTMRRQIALKDESHGWTLPLVTTFSVLAIHIVVVVLLFRNEKLWRSFLLLPLGSTPTFWDCIWRISMTDCLVRYFSIMAKILLVGLNGSSSQRLKRRHQAHALTLIERGSIVYRGFLPLPVWYRFFLNDAYGHFFASFCSGVYLAFKIMANIEELKQLLATAIAFARSEMHYGRVATNDEVMEAGGVCAICQERMKSPLALRCRHVFCEDCVSEWFDRERTCPLCRAVVKTAGLCTYGDGSTSLLLQLF